MGEPEKPFEIQVIRVAGAYQYAIQRTILFYLLMKGESDIKVLQQISDDIIETLHAYLLRMITRDGMPIFRYSIEFE